jgi:hypothetical protein
MEVGAPVLLMLARDVAPDLPDDVYAPYFAGVFSVEDDEWVAVPEDASDETTREVAGSDDRGRVHLAGLRRLVDTVTAELEEHRREVEGLLPARLVRDPYRWFSSNLALSSLLRRNRWSSRPVADFLRRRNQSSPNNQKIDA